MDDHKFVLLGAGVAAVVVVALVLKKVGGEVAQAINPLNNDNIINQGVTSVYQAVTGSEGTIGTDIYDATHGGSVDVTSENNIAYRSANAWVKYLTGDKDQTLGGWLYDVTH